MPPAPRIDRGLPKPVRRERPGMSRAHTDAVGDLPCLACGSLRNVECHHLLRTGEKGMGRKSSDQWGIPLCRKCHNPTETGSLHHDGNEERWLAARGIMGREIARTLWEERGKPQRMLRVVVRDLNRRGVYVSL